jgi:hypothetical protein
MVWTRAGSQGTGRNTHYNSCTRDSHADGNAQASPRFPEDDRYPLRACDGSRHSRLVRYVYRVTDRNSHPNRRGPGSAHHGRPDHYPDR